MYDVQKMKHEPPELAGKIIKRRALTEKLNTKRRVIFIHAPAGFGKTTLAALWARSGKRGAIWVDLDECGSDFPGNLGNSSAAVFDNFNSAKHDGLLMRLLKERVSKLVILSRNPPRTWFDGLIIKREADIINENDLRFTKDEIKELFAKHGMTLSVFGTEAVEGHTGGWVSLIMSSIIFGGSLSSFTEDNMNYYCGRYFLSQLNGFWSGKEKELLLKTALPDYISGDYCEGVAGCSDAMGILSRLSEATGFLFAGKDGLYYQPVFRKFLLAELERDKTLQKERLYRNAAAFLISRGSSANALEIAFKYGKDETIEEILITMCDLRSLNIGVGELCRLIKRIEKQFPEKAVKERPILAQKLRWLRFAAGCEEDGALCMRDVISEMGIALAVLSFTQGLPFFHKSRRDYTGALPLTKEFFSGTGRISEPFLNEDCRLLEKLLDGGLLYEKNDLNGAYDIITELEPLIVNAGPELSFCYNILKCEVLFLQGKDKFAFKTLRKTEKMITECCAEYLFPNLWAYKTKIALYQGDSGAALEWLENFAIDTDAAINHYQIFQNLTTARALIVSGKPERAVKFLNRLLDFSKIYKRTVDIVEILTLKAVCGWRTDKKEAVSDLEDAVFIASGAGLVNPIITEGADILPALEYSLNRLRLGYCQPETDGEFLLRLYILSSGTAKKSRGLFHNAQKKPPRLSKRQMEVLRLLSENLTYEQIAEKMGVKITTVRDHVTHLYEKLGVNSSKDALERGRELGAV